jgi:S-adenosylmethionine:tRNA ribosyltransferase-isomerase
MVMWVDEGDCIIENITVVKSCHTELRTSDFDYRLPPEQIATHPSTRREDARLLRLDRFRGTLNHAHFREIAGLLPPGALVVLNETKVFPARLRGSKQSGGAVELLLTRMVGVATDGLDGRGSSRGELWEGLARNVGRDADLELRFAGGVTARVLERLGEGRVRLRFEGLGGKPLMARLDEIGEVPLPPYIEAARKRETPAAAAAAADDDRQRYQTVYAAAPGAVAAPTAGLHFTPELLDGLVAAGHEIARLTLHVGPGTFRPVKTEEPTEHVMDEELYEIPEATAEAIAVAREKQRPVVAIGTTVVRALESAIRDGNGKLRAGRAATRLFLMPGAKFEVVTDLVTNFHLPRSTLLMLVAAFAGRERVLDAYRAAIETGYRFYSYGDAMLITGRAGA